MITTIPDEWLRCCDRFPRGSKSDSKNRNYNTATVTIEKLLRELVDLISRLTRQHLLLTLKNVQDCEKKRKHKEFSIITEAKMQQFNLQLRKRKFPAENYSSTLSLPPLKLLLQKFLTFPPANSFERLFFTGCTLFIHNFLTTAFPQTQTPLLLSSRFFTSPPSPQRGTSLYCEYTFNSTLPPRAR